MSLPFRRADCRRTCVGVVVVRRCFGVNESIFPSGMGKDRRAREGRWVSCNCHAFNRFGRRFISSTPKKGQQTATTHCQPGARAGTLPTAGMGERALRCARARVVFFWRRHSVSGIRCGAWRPGLFVIMIRQLNWGHLQKPQTSKLPALPIEQSTPGFANSRVRAPPHVHPRGLGSRPSSLRGLNEEFYKKKLKTKKLRFLED